MTNMASIRTFISCLVVMSLFLEAKSDIENFVSLDCKSTVVAHYGTQTILECVIKPQKQITNTKIQVVIWKFKGKPLFIFSNGSIDNRSEEGFRFAEASWSDTNMNVSLRITNTKLSDAGEYECSVMTDSGDADEKVHLSVKANYIQRDISSIPEKIIPNEDFTLICEAHGGYPKGDLRWVVDDLPWNSNPKVEVTEGQNGLLNLSSKLTMTKDSKFGKFVCEMYNASGEKVDERKYDYVFHDPVVSDLDKKGLSLTQIVAPVVVIGSLIVGLLVLLLCRRRHTSGDQDVPEMDVNQVMEPLSPDKLA